MSWSISHAVLHEFFLLYMKKYRMLLKTSIVARYLRLAVALSNDFRDYRLRLSLQRTLQRLLVSDPSPMGHRALRKKVGLELVILFFWIYSICFFEDLQKPAVFFFPMKMRVSALAQNKREELTIEIGDWW